MRKELTVYVPTTEQGEEVSLRGLSADGKIVLFEISGVGRFAINTDELKQAFTEIELFQAINKKQDKEQLLIGDINEVEYGS